MRTRPWKPILALSAILGAICATAEPLAATLTSNLDVSLTVTPACSAVSASPLNFGSVSPGASPAATTTISVTCGSGVAYSIASGFGHQEMAGLRQMWLDNTDSTNVVSYSLFRDSNHTLLWS